MFADGSSGALDAIYIVCGIASIVLSSMLVVAGLRFRLLRRHPSWIILLIGVMDAAFSCKFLVNAIVLRARHATSHETDHRTRSFGLIRDDCLTEALWSQVFGNGSQYFNFVWTVNYLLEMYNPLRSTRSFIPFYHAFAWGATAITSALIVARRQYGLTVDETCAIRGSLYWANLTLFDIPLVVILFVMTTSVPYSYCRLRFGSQDTQDLRWRLFIRHTAYVVLFVSAWVWSLLFTTVPSVQKSRTFLYLTAIGTSSQGALLSSRRLLESDVRNHVLPRLFPCWRRNATSAYDSGGIMHDVSLRAPLLQSPSLNQSGSGKAETSGSMWDAARAVRLLDGSSLLDAVARGVDQSPDPPFELEKDDALSTSNDRLSVAFRDADCVPTTSGTQCRVLCPQSFGQLRAACGIDRGTLSRQVAASSAPSQSAGQSSSYFYFSPSQAFILKTVSASEIDTLLEMLPSLCRYVVERPATLIAVPVGAFVMAMPFGGDLYSYLAIGVLPGSPRLRFDLKGSTAGRSVGVDPNLVASSSCSVTLKDLDFQALNEVSRVVRLPRSVATAVMQQLEGDVAILQAAGVMDYSLLVGVYDHDPSHQCPPGAYLSQSGHQYYRFGIIDYLQKFSRMKRFEHRIKSLSVGVLNSTQHSCVDSDVYGKRFLHFVRDAVLTL